MPYILKHFYLTGGTALSGWYLHHRESLDLDFFSEQEVNALYINKWFKEKQKEIGHKSLSHTQELGFNFFNLRYPDGKRLKVDFSYYPSQRIQKGIVWNGLEIDSLYDIAVNKFNTISMSPRAKDYVDLYFIVKKEGYIFDRLRKDAAIKFGIHIETIHLARQFLRSKEFTDLPKMLVPFDRQEMEEFFLKLAKGMEKEIFK